MTWFTRFFDKQKLNQTQQRPQEVKRQDFTGVMQAVAEETILASAYWLIGFVNTHLENKASTQVQDEEEVAPQPPTASEGLMPKVVALMEQFNDRSQIITALECRLQTAETALREHSDSAREASPPVSVESFAALASRLSEVEAYVEEAKATPETSAPSSQSTAALEARIAHLEKLLSRYSVVPKLIEQNRQTIDALQHRISAVEFPQTDNHHSDREASPANFS